MGALVTHRLATEDLARAGRAKLVFSGIHTHGRAEGKMLRAAAFDEKMGIPIPLAKDPFALFRLTGLGDAPVVFPKMDRKEEHSARAEARRLFPCKRACPRERPHAYKRERRYPCLFPDALKRLFPLYASHTVKRGF